MYCQFFTILDFVYVRKMIRGVRPRDFDWIMLAQKTLLSKDVFSLHYFNLGKKWKIHAENFTKCFYEHAIYL